MISRQPDNVVRLVIRYGFEQHDCHQGKIPSLFVSKRKNKLVFSNHELIMNEFSSNCLNCNILFTSTNCIYMYRNVKLISMTFPYRKSNWLNKDQQRVY